MKWDSFFFLRCPSLFFTVHVVRECECIFSRMRVLPLVFPSMFPCLPSYREHVVSALPLLLPLWWCVCVEKRKRFCDAYHFLLLFSITYAKAFISLTWLCLAVRMICLTSCECVRVCMSVTVYKVCVGKHFTIILKSEAGALAIAYINMYMLAKHTHMVLRENCGKTMMLLHKTCIDGVESLLVHFTENCDLLCRMCLSVCLCLCLFCFYLSYALCECLRPCLCPCVCVFIYE